MQNKDQYADESGYVTAALAQYAVRARCFDGGPELSSMQRGPGAVTAALTYTVWSADPALLRRLTYPVNGTAGRSSREYARTQYSVLLYARDGGIFIDLTESVHVHTTHGWKQQIQIRTGKISEA